MKIYVALMDGEIILAAKDKKKLLKEETMAGTIATSVKDGDVVIQTVRLID